MEPNKAHHANHEIESKMSCLVITVDQVLKSKVPPGRNQNLHLGIEIIAKDIEQNHPSSHFNITKTLISTRHLA